jgi:ABC-type dipeptide/oligopeptide/nickel transport system ATPase component
MSSRFLLKVEGLNIWFDKGRKVVDNVSFSIEKSEIFSLVGESGSGKTLSCLSLCKLLPPEAHYSGKVWFYHDSMTTNLLQLGENKIRKFRGRKISYIFQESLASLNPFLGVGYQIQEVLLFGKGLSKKEAKARVLTLLEGVRFPDPGRIYASFPHQISGGEAQRVMIAMALALEPVLLICDEPTSNLDVTVQMQIIELLSQKKKEFGFSMLFVTHDLSLVESFSDRVGVISQGKIVEEGPKIEVFGSPKHPYTKALIDAGFKTR